MAEINKSGLASQIENEIRDYFDRTVNLSDNNEYSQARLVRRISLFENQVYPTGKFDGQDNYKFWFDIQNPRINSEVKNIDYDTKNVRAYSELKGYVVPSLLVNLSLKEWMRQNGIAETINSDIEYGSAWGNVVWKKVKKGYERADLRNFYVINQTAECLDESPVIERHQFSQTDLKAYKGMWKNVEDAIKDCASDTYSVTAETRAKETTTPYYDIYERNGEVCVKDLKEFNGITPKEGDEDLFVMAKVIVVGSKGIQGNVDIKYVLFANELNKKMSDIYKEYHRGRYKGRWMREGIIELLFDCQVRANQIGNQIAQGLEWASKAVFTSEDKLAVQNITTDLRNGDILRTKATRQLEVRMQGLDQLIADWNRIIQLANDICNSQEVVQGIAPASGTPLGTTQLLNQNAGKLFDFLREKLAIPLSEIFEQWIVPDLIKELKLKKIIRLSGDSDILDRLLDVVVNSWYNDNLMAIGPHTKDIADALKEEQKKELKSRPELLMESLDSMWEGYKPSVVIDITGESLTLDADAQAIASLIALEGDLIRRTAMIEDVARMKGYDYAGLPKTPPAPPQPTQPLQPNQVMQPQNG
jgi:hypothetical protein